MSMQAKKAIPFDLLNPDEIDRLFVVADSLKAKIGNMQEYSNL